jgi:RHS repeat-associated protein
VDTVGREFFFTYTNSMLTGIADPINRRLTFQYTGNKLSLFRDARNNPNNYSYNSGGRLSEVFDGRGIRVMANNYDAQGRLISQFNGRNSLWTAAYNDAANTTTVTDPNQKQIVYSFDSGHKMVSFTNRLTQQNRVKIDYDPNNNRSGVNDPNNLNNVYGYLYDDRSGFVTKSTDPDLNTRKFVYDSRNNPTHATDELNNTTTMGYDSRGNLISLSDALSGATSVSYDAFGQPISITDPNLNITLLGYDAQGNLVRIEDAMHNVTQYGYDAVGRRISSTDARNKITRFTYDENDNLTSVQMPIGATTYTYDQADNMIAITDPAQKLTTFEYDANNNLVLERDATRVFFVQHIYDPLDRLISTRDKRGNTTTFEYDPEGRLLSVKDPMLNRTAYTYDGNGNRLSVTDANNQMTRFTYDMLNRLKSVEDPLGNSELKEYDPAGRLISESDARGNSTRYGYDETNNLIRVDDAEGGVTRYVYDKNHNLREQIDPNMHISRFTYDKANRMILSFDPLDNRYDYEYDGVGNRISQTDAKRQTIRFAYDDNNRLATIFYPDSTVQLTYDLSGNVTRVVDPLGTTSYTYDVLNRVTSYTDVYGKTLGYQYDPNGNISVLTYPDGKQVSYQYDANNRMISLRDWNNRTVSYQYNNLNLLTMVTPPSITDAGATIYTYDVAGRLIGMSNGSSNSYSFTLDRNGNHIAASIQEPLNSRVAAATQSYHYDIANRIQSAGATTFSFDANGNMTGKTENGVTTTYVYDFNDRLKSDQTNTYFYNGQGVRLTKSRAGSVTRYVVDVNRELSQVLCETDGSGAIMSYYIYGQGLVYKVLPSGAYYYYQFDYNGSTISLKSDAGSYTNRYSYDPYGKVANSAEATPGTNNLVPNPFKFGGRYGLMDDGNGLVYARARYYSPELGRFLTKDPLTGDLKNGLSLNRYIYALDNPIEMIDPDGMKAINWKNLYMNVAKSLAENLNQEVLIVGSAKKIAASVANSHGFDKIGEKAARFYKGTRFFGATNVVKEIGSVWNNPDMDWTEKAARVSLRISDAAFSAIPVNRAASVITGTSFDASYESRFNLIKKGVDALFDRKGTTVDWTEYNRNEQIIINTRQKQRERAAKKAAGAKVTPKAPATAPVSRTGPKPAVRSSRGTVKR